MCEPIKPSAPAIRTCIVVKVIGQSYIPEGKYEVGAIAWFDPEPTGANQPAQFVYRSFKPL